MQYAKSSLRMFLGEPFSWLFYCAFLPARFERDFEIYGLQPAALAGRMRKMLRLALPLFLCAYPLTLAIHVCLAVLSPANSCSLFQGVCGPGTSASDILLNTIYSALLGIAIGIIVGSLMGINIGVTIGLALAIALGITTGIAEGIALGIVFGLIEGTMLATGRGLPIIIGWCLALNAVFSFAGGPLMGLLGSLAVGVAISLGRGLAGSTRDTIHLRFLAGIFVGCLGGGLTWFGAAFIVQSSSQDISGFLLDATWGAYAGGIAFVVSYILGSYRLLLYPVSACSMFTTYLRSRHQSPSHVFAHLHNSSLYWDEYVYLSLPGLKQLLHGVVIQDTQIEQLLQEISFIVAKRPRQLSAARSALQEIAIRDLESRQSLRDIASDSGRFADLLPAEGAQIDPQRLPAFDSLYDVSKEAARYYSPLSSSVQARRDALATMLARLERVYPDTALRDAQLNQRLSTVVSSWQGIVQKEQEILEKKLKTIKQNPYNPGPILELGDSLFVGRLDLGRRLQEALGQHSHRPTFFLHGERRMGKSSTLKQLPYLLGTRYLPIIYNLQSRGISSSAAAFLHKVAEEIYNVMEHKGLQVKALAYEELHAANKENEASAYRIFDEWFKDVDSVLVQADRVLLLAFDEFEKLEEAGQDRYLNLRLLLDWFRSVIEHYPRLALLFSGVRTISEMGRGWAGYFVNTQTLKVSFLKQDEARKLISQPVPDFPGEEIYNEEVVEEILSLTGGHPFLIQAVCAELIDELNIENRGKAGSEDVAKAVEMVLEHWWDGYFRDMWDRTTAEQRNCLFVLGRVESITLPVLKQQTRLDARTLNITLKELIQRDLVALEDGSYQMTTPIYREWINRNSAT